MSKKSIYELPDDTRIRIHFESKTGKGRFTTLDFDFGVYSVPYELDDMLKNSCVFLGSEMPSIMGSKNIVRGVLDDKGGYKIQSFQWTFKDGHITCSGQGKQGEKRIRNFIATHCPLVDFFEVLDIHITNDEFVEIYQRELAKRQSKGDNSDGQGGDAFERTIGYILNPRNKYVKSNKSHAEQGEPDSIKYFTVATLKRLGEECGLWLDR
jgi:hypothetical protein